MIREGAGRVQSNLFDNQNGLLLFDRHDVFNTPEHLFLVMEYVPGGTLFQLLEKEGVLSELVMPRASTPAASDEGSICFGALTLGYVRMCASLLSSVSTM